MTDSPFGTQNICLRYSSLKGLLWMTRGKGSTFSQKNGENRCLIGVLRGPGRVPGEEALVVIRLSPEKNYREIGHGIWGIKGSLIHPKKDAGKGCRDTLH